MADTKNSISHTADHIEQVAKESAKDKQSGNTRALLFQNLPGARAARSFRGGVLGAIETAGDTLYRTMTLAARPQDLKYTGKILRNGVKATIAEGPQVQTNGIKEYRQNLRAPKLQRDSLKQYHEPYLDDTKFFDTHGTDLSLAPKQSDNWFKKIVKGIPFIAGKVVKVPIRAASTVVGAMSDTARWMKAQKPRDLVTLNFIKTTRNKTSHAWNKLTSRNYNANTTGEISKKKESSETKSVNQNSGEKKGFWSRLWPFGKKKKENNNAKEDIKKEDKIQQIEKETPQHEVKQEKNKEQTPKVVEKETIAPEVLSTIVTGYAAIEGLKQAFDKKDKKGLDEAKDKILRAQAIEKNINKNNLPDEHKVLFQEIKSTATDIGQLKYKLEEAKVIDIKESNEAMGDYINQEQRKFTKLYNNKEHIKDEDITKRIKSLQKYQKSGGKIVFTGKQKQNGEALSGKLDSIVIEDNKVKVGFTTDDGHAHTDEIQINDVFDSKFSVHAPEAKVIDITNKQAA